MNAVNMDILPYVDSRAIREHLATIGHRFTPLEAAVLIRHSLRLSLEERNRAWRELMACSEDVPLPVNEWFPESMSLHEWLKADIRRSELAVELFGREDEGAVWLADGSRQFSSFAECAAALRACGGYAQKVWRGEGGEALTIKADLLPGGGYALLDADGSGLPKPSSVMGLFSFWIDVPTPFRTGDLLQDENGDLLILLDDDRWHMTPEERKELEANGSLLDMCVTGRGLGPGAPASGSWLYLELDYPENGNDASNKGLS